MTTSSISTATLAPYNLKIADLYMQMDGFAGSTPNLETENALCRLIYQVQLRSQTDDSQNI